jgi:hypothetical protein
MECCICLNKVSEKENINIHTCNCKLTYHRICYQNMIKISNISCAYCRTSVNKNQNRPFTINNWLFQEIFSLPPALAILLWFIVSWIFVLFFLPYIFIYEMIKSRDSILWITRISILWITRISIVVGLSILYSFLYYQLYLFIL